MATDTNYKSRELHPDVAHVHPEIANKLLSLMSESKAIGRITYRLPRKSLAAGHVLGHAVQTMEAHFEKHKPMIFKFGWTHDPPWRWSNNLYGYALAKDCWEQTVVVFASHEPYGPAMLEAALIEKYEGILATYFV